MNNLFDLAAFTAFDIVTTTFGNTAIWKGVEAPIIKRDVTGKEAVLDVEFDPDLHKIEYRSGVLEGLKESVDNGNTETLQIDNISYYVVAVKRKFDGNTYEASLREA